MDNKSQVVVKDDGRCKCAIGYNIRVWIFDDRTVAFDDSLGARKHYSFFPEDVEILEKIFKVLKEAKQQGKL
jgi:hypothetical protein